jgi:hypothetical protein
LDRWLLQAFSPAHRDHTIAHLAEQAPAEPPAIPNPQMDPNIVAEYDAKLGRYGQRWKRAPTPPSSPGGSPKPRQDGGGPSTSRSRPHRACPARYP